METGSKKRVIIDAIHKLTSTNEYVSEIETNCVGKVFYKERGVRKYINVPLYTEEEYKEAIDGLIEASGLTSKRYLVEGRYNLSPERFARLHIVMPPATPVPAMTMAIKTAVLTDLTAIQAAGSFDTDVSRFLKAAIGAKLTIVISGGTGAGKTTMLEAMTAHFNDDERIGVCEDSPELKLKAPNTVYLNSTVWAPGLDSKDVAPLHWVVQQINRMRVDRIIIGETRGAEFFDFITAANSGAEGSLTTLHANDGPAAMKKMATFVYMAIDVPPRIINEMISSAVDIIIQLGKCEKTKGHKVLSINEVTNAISGGDSPTVALNPLFTYDSNSGKWIKKFATDKLKDRLAKYGYDANTYSTKEEEIQFGQPGGGLPSYFKGE